jgi:hypothetical protein
MKCGVVRLVPLALPLWFSSPALSQWYSWRDAGGGLHVTDQFATIPEDARSRAEVVPFGGRVPRADAGSAKPDAGVTPPASDTDPVQTEIARREERLAERQAHLQLLRGSTAGHTDEQLRLENLLDEEIRTEAETLAALRRKAAEGVQR